MVDMFFFFKQKTAYELRISDWSSDVCSSDLQTVQFTLVDDSGGALLQSSATTNASGQATITYRAGGTTGSQDGVKITGAVAGATSGIVNLTVGDRKSTRLNSSH